MEASTKGSRGLSRAIAGFVGGAIVALIVNSLWQLREDIARVLWNAYVSGRPMWLWVGLFWFTAALTGAVVTSLWNPGAFRRARQMRKDNPAGFINYAMITGGVTLAPLVVAALLASSGLPRGNVRILFAQEKEIGPLSFANYGTNGAASYVVHPKGDGLAEAYAEIRFHAYGPSVEANCGWIVFFPKGIDLTGYRSLRFLVRGERGNERLIVKAKDARGHEGALELGRGHLAAGKITAEWEEAVVPFNHFGNVDFSRMENISLASNGVLNRMEPVTIRVARFRFSK